MFADERTLSAWRHARHGFLLAPCQARVRELAGGVLICTHVREHAVRRTPGPARTASAEQDHGMSETAVAEPEDESRAPST